ncbi:MAG: hypothetical protein H0T80_13085 [Betaproteobacteria bacterium]|nr:hypothetical protein [Betaproteobacteria bacterium]
MQRNKNANTLFAEVPDERPVDVPKVTYLCSQATKWPASLAGLIFKGRED